MALVVGTFACIAALLWLSIFGYVLVLHSVARRRRTPAVQSAAYPEIGVVIPTFNEAALIVAKLQDLQRTAYPPDRMTIVVVDGGSTDGTVELVQREIAAGMGVQLIHDAELRGKAAQLNRALGTLSQDIVIVTDVDARLESQCITELVRVLAGDPRTALVGATVWPASALLEERLHWRWLNYLWWLEGEVLSFGTVAAPCYAIRRALLPALAAGVRADDIHLAMAASARGLRVRTCRTAHATEVRVPQTPRDLVSYRRRRAHEYVVELFRAASAPATPLTYRVMRLARLWQLRIVPKLAVAFALGAAALLCTAHWVWAALALAAFSASVLFSLLASRGAPATWRRSSSIGWAAVRLIGLTWVSLLGVARSSPQAEVE